MGLAPRPEAPQGCGDGRVSPCVELTPHAAKQAAISLACSSQWALCAARGQMSQCRANVGCQQASVCMYWPSWHLEWYSGMHPRGLLQPKKAPFACFSQRDGFGVKQHEERSTEALRCADCSSRTPTAHGASEQSPSDPLLPNVRLGGLKCVHHVRECEACHVRYTCTHSYPLRGCGRGNVSARHGQQRQRVHPLASLSPSHGAVHSAGRTVPFYHPFVASARLHAPP